MKKNSFRTLTVIFCLCTATSTAQTVHNLNSNMSQVLPYNSVNDVFRHNFSAEAKAVRLFSMNIALQNADNVNIGDTVVLQLFENQIYISVITNTIIDVSGNFTITLSLPDYPMAFAIITTSSDGKSLVNVSIPELDKSFGSRYNRENADEFYLIEIDKKKIERPTMENDAIPIPASSQQLQDIPPPQPVLPNCIPTIGSNTNTPATIDLLVVYTPVAANSSYANSHGGINNVIATMVALGNTCLSNSKTGITLRLAHAAEISYVEDNDMGLALHRLQNPSDGYMDNVYTLRRNYNADLVQLITNDNNLGGIGYVVTPAAFYKLTYNWSFSVVGIKSVGDDYPCSIHEIGHNVGLGHGANMLPTPSNGSFPYSYGWDWTGTDGVKYCSVMGYWDGNRYADGIKRRNTLYFSNPNVKHMGAPTGNALQADAARHLREIKHIVAYYNNLNNYWSIGYPVIIKVSAAFSNGILTINGRGAMQNWTAGEQPWYCITDDITRLAINHGVTAIGNSAFSNCSNLTSVTIPNSVRHIGISAFDGCSSLTSITSLAVNPPTAAACSFCNVPQNIPVYIPCGSMSAYQSAAEWSNFTNYHTLDDVSAVSALSITKTNASFIITWQSNAASYELYRNNNFLTSLNTTTYTDNDLTNGIIYCYKIKAIDEYCESDFSEETCETYSNTGIEQLAMENGQLIIYPNPTTGKLHIISAGASTQVLPVQVYNIAGQSVEANLHVCPNNDNDTITIDISHLANGLYFLKVGNKTVKIIKE